MGYVDKNLMPSEQIIWRGREWWWSALGSTLLVAGLALLMISSLWLLAKYIGWRAQDYAVTSYRVLSKRGAISQRVEEVPLRTVESTLIQQGLVDRVFKVGTVVVTGTGGTRVAFRSVAEAADLRRHVQTLVSELRQGQTQRFMQPPPNPQIAFG